MHPKIALSLKFLLFYPDPKGDKMNFKLFSLKKWDMSHFYEINTSFLNIGKEIRKVPNDLIKTRY